MALHQSKELPKQAERGGTPRRLVLEGREPVSQELRAALGRRYRYELE